MFEPGRGLYIAIVEVGAVFFAGQHRMLGALGVFFIYTFVSLGHCGFLFALDNNNTDFLKTFREATLC